MPVVEKVYSLVQHVTTADIRALEPYRRRLLAAQLKRLVAIAEKVEAEPVGVGVIADLKDGGSRE